MPEPARHNRFASLASAAAMAATSVSFVALALALTLAPTPAAAQTGTVTILVGYPAGATSDALTRVTAEAMSRILQQNVIVENKAGAGGRIANELLKAAAPDGTTLLLAPVATISIFPTSFAGQLRYDPFKDFAPVAHLSNFQIGIGVNAATPVKTLAEYVAYVKADTDKNGFYASAAAGSLPHFFGVMFARTAGITLTHVPYKGTAPAMLALASGEITAASTLAADIRPLVDAGKARLLAVAGEKRDPNSPNVPTFKELGYDLVAQPWYALFAPAGTPPAVVDRLSKAAVQAMNDPAVHKRLVEMGLEPTGYGPARLATIMKDDFERWAPVIKASGFKPGQ